MSGRRCVGHTRLSARLRARLHRWPCTQHRRQGDHTALVQTLQRNTGADVFELAVRCLLIQPRAHAARELSTRRRRLGGFDYGMVGLFEIVDPNLPSLYPKPPIGKARGEISLIFDTDNLDEIRKRLEARGHPLVCEPLRVELPGYPPKIEMTLRDPNGVFINLIQTLHE